MLITSNDYLIGSDSGQNILKLLKTVKQGES